MATTYTSKVGIGETAWFMRNNKPVSAMVESIIIKIIANNNDGSLSRQTVEYGFRNRDGNGMETHTQDEIFATKEELIKSL